MYYVQLATDYIIVNRKMGCFTQHVVHQIMLPRRYINFYWLLPYLLSHKSVINIYHCSFIIQVIHNKGYDGAKADLWSCGVILFVLMAGFLPFEENNLMALYKKVSFTQCSFLSVLTEQSSCFCWCAQQLDFL